MRKNDVITNFALLEYPFMHVKHEIMEKSLIADGLSQHDAHIITSKKYDYATEAKEFYAKIKKYKK